MINKNNILSNNRKPHKDVRVEIKMSVPTMYKMTNRPIITKYIGNKLARFFANYSKHLKTAKENVINKSWLTFFGRLKIICRIDANALPQSILITINERNVDEQLCLKGAVAGFTIYY